MSLDATPSHRPSPADQSCSVDPSSRGDERARRSQRTTDLLAQRYLAVAADDLAATQRCEADLVVVNLPVARAIASRYQHRGVDDDDLEQLACEGLVKAVQRFEPGRTGDFLSFAVPTVRGEIQRFFRDHGWSVRPPRRVQDLQWRLHRAAGDLQQRLGREPSLDELCAHLDIDRAQHDEAAQAYGAFRPLSLDAPVSDGSDLTWGDLLPAQEDGQSRLEDVIAARDAVRRLSPRDMHVVHRRFALGHTQREIGADLGVTQMQVSRILSRVCAQLRAVLEPVPEPPPHGRTGPTGSPDRPVLDP